MKRKARTVFWYVLSVAFGVMLGFAVAAYAESDATVGPAQVFEWMPPEVRAVAFLVTGIGLGLFVVVALAIKFIVQPSKDGIGERFDARLDRLEDRLDKIDDRFNGFDDRFNGFEKDLRSLMRMWRNGGRSTGEA